MDKFSSIRMSLIGNYVQAVRHVSDSGIVIERSAKVDYAKTYNEPERIRKCAAELLEAADFLEGKCAT